MAALSSVSEEGVMETRNQICEVLLKDRSERRVASGHIHSIANRLHVAVPQQRDQVERPPVLPPSVLARQRAAQQGVQRMDTDEQEQEEDETYPRPRALVNHDVDMRKRYLLKNPEWRFDVVPEIYEGHNVADFVDPEIDARLEELEREEDELQRQFENAMQEDEFDIDEGDMALIDEWNQTRDTKMAEHRAKRTLSRVAGAVTRKRKLGTSTEEFQSTMETLGFAQQAERIVARERSRGRTRSKSRGRSKDKVRRPRSTSSGRSLARQTAYGGSKVREQKAQMLAYNTQRKRNRQAKIGDADRHIPDMKPKHLFSGKMGFKKDRR